MWVMGAITVRRRQARQVAADQAGTIAEERRGATTCRVVPEAIMNWLMNATLGVSDTITECDVPIE